MEKTFFQDYQNLITGISKLKKSEDNPFFHSKYTPLRDILEEAKKACKENQFIFVQYPFIEQGKSILITKLIHISGQEIVGQINLPVKDENDPQKLGSAITYMRRYSLTSIFGIEEEDDDGNEASQEKPVKKEVKTILITAEQKKKIDEALFLIEPAKTIKDLEDKMGKKIDDWTSKEAEAWIKKLNEKTK